MGRIKVLDLHDIQKDPVENRGQKTRDKDQGNKSYLDDLDVIISLNKRDLKFLNVRNCLFNSS